MKVSAFRPADSLSNYQTLTEQRMPAIMDLDRLMNTSTMLLDCPVAAKPRSDSSRRRRRCARRSPC